MRLELATLPVWYINLDSEPRKAEQIETWLTAKGFIDINRWPAYHHPAKGVGCAISHNELLRHLATLNTPAIVFEDDARPWHWKTHIDIPDDADAYYLGLSKWGLAGNKGRHNISATRVDGKTWRLYNMLAAHGIVYLDLDYIHWLIRATGTMVELGTNQDKARAQTLKYWHVYGPEKAHIYQYGKHRATTKVNIAELDPLSPIELL